MSDEISYHSQNLWQYVDKQISTATVSLDKFISKTEWGISPPKLKININNHKARVVNYISLNHQEVFTFILKFKEYENKIGTICKEITDDQNKQVSFSLKFKKNLIVSFLYRTEYSGPCIRLVISDKNSDYLDCEKAFMSIYDFLSLVMIVGQFRSGYLQTVDNIHTLVFLKDLGEKVDSLNDKISGYYSEFLQLYTAKTKLIENQLQIEKRDVPSEFTPFLDNASENDKLQIIKESEENQASSSTNRDIEEKPEENIHDQMSDFIDKNRDSFDLGLTKLDETKPLPNTTAAKVLSDTFTEKMLTNDVSNLEMYLTNIANDELPFSKFCEIIKSKLSFDPIDGITKEDRNSLNYLLSNYLKVHIKQSIEKKMEIPANITPIVIENVNTNADKISLAYDLFLYCIYYTQLKNVLKEKDYSIIANKELVCFILKTLSAPCVFSIIKQLDEKLVVSEVINRYRKYRQNGIFSRVEKSIFENKSIQFAPSEEVIKNEASRMYNAVSANWAKITIKSTFEKMNMIRLSYEDIQKNKLTDEQIKKILLAEFNFRKNNKVDFAEAGINGFDDIPITIAEKYEITKKKFDNTNMKRFIQEKCKDNEKFSKYCLELTNNINESFRDLKSISIDFNLVPEEVLKSIILWDLTKDSKVANNYIYYLELIQKSTLTRDMIISMLTNIQDINDPTFANSFIAAREE